MAKPRNKPLQIGVHIEGLRETLKAFNQLPKDASAELRTAALEISEEMATAVRAAAMGDSNQSALLAPTVKARRDRVPTIEVGGDAAIGRQGEPAWGILFGAEFGANQYPQFRPHRGREGYFIFPTIEAEQDAISARWQAAADTIVQKFTADDAAGAGEG